MLVSSHKKILHNDKVWTFNFVLYYGNLWNPQLLKHTQPLGKNLKSIFANGIQWLCDFSHKLAPLKQTDHDMMSFIVEG